MNIKLKIITIQLESLRSILHFLLNFKQPTDKIVIYCSQQLDKVIFTYHKAALNNIRPLLNNTLSPFFKTQTSHTSTGKAFNLQKNTTANQIIPVDNIIISTAILPLGPIDVSIQKGTYI